MNFFRNSNSRRGRAGKATKCTESVLNVQNLLFNFLNLLLFDVVLVAIAFVVAKPPSFIDVCKLLGIRMCMFLV